MFLMANHDLEINKVLVKIMSLVRIISQLFLKVASQNPP